MRLWSKLFHGTGVVLLFSVLLLASVYAVSTPDQTQEPLAVMAPAAAQEVDRINDIDSEMEKIEKDVLNFMEQETVVTPTGLRGEEQLIKLRMEREKAWAEQIASLEKYEQNEALLQYQQQHFQEQQLELLMNAKGFPYSVVVITDKRVNVLVPEKEAEAGYQRLHELVTGNLDVLATDVCIIPVQDE